MDCDTGYATMLRARGVGGDGDVDEAHVQPLGALAVLVHKVCNVLGEQRVLGHLRLPVDLGECEDRVVGEGE